MQELKIPLALNDDGIAVDPINAKKEGRYYCPGCGDQLILKKGQKKKTHFSHKATDNCSYETVIHKLAKRLITQAIDVFVNKNGASPVIERKCPICNTIREQTLPIRILEAIEEKRLDSGFIGDVVIFSDDSAIAVIEVKVSHAVPDKKAEKIGIPFIEVDGEAIVENPRQWKPIIDSFKPFRCKECSTAIARYKEAINSISNQTGIVIPTEYYRTAYTECWRCCEPILIFAWPSGEKGSIVLKEPRPRTIQYRYSKMVGNKYWTNTCPYCKSIQGDFFLYNEPDSPLFGFHCGEDSGESYISDMRTLAVIYHHGL